MRVQDLMTSPVITIRSDKALIVVQEIMKWNHVRHVPVVNGAGELVGMVSQRDLLAASVSTLATSTPNADKRQHLAMSDVERIMKRDVWSVPPDETIQYAATMMRAHRVGSLPVIDGGHLVGIITDSDLIRLVQHLPNEALDMVKTPLPRGVAAA